MIFYLFSVSQQEMTNEYRTMRIKLNDLAVELQKNFTDVELEENDRFPGIMKDFLVKSLHKFEELQDKYTSMEVAYKDVVTYYGEDPINTKPDEFFGVFKTFITSFEVCILFHSLFKPLHITEFKLCFTEIKK